MLVSFSIALGILTGGLFWAGPLLMNSGAPQAGQLFYVLLRVLVIVLFSFSAVRFWGKNIYHALSFTGLLMFLDQVVIKGVWFAIQLHHHPGDWQGMTLPVVLFNNAFAYIVFLPLVLLLGFMGAGAGIFLNLKYPPRKAST